MSIKVGLAANPIPPLELTVAAAAQAESEGYDSLWYPDHLMGWFPKAVWTPENSSIVNLLPSPHLYLDTTITMAVVGRATSRVLLGTGVTDPIRRPPPELARTFLTLSHVTEGRAQLGIGAGERENIEPYGLDYRFQVSKLEEALHLIRLLWESRDPVDFDGRFWKLRRAVLDLEPYGGRYPPVWVGAHGPRMLRITGRYGDGWLPSYPMTPEDYGERLNVIRKAAAEAGRDPASIEAGYQMYTAAASDHETAHLILGLPLARAMSLVAPSAQWERAGRAHPLGKNFEGLRDYVPEWYSKEQLEEAMGQFDLDVLHDVVPHGTADELIEQIEPFVEAGLEHLVLVNIAPIAGFEYVEAARAGMLEVMRILRG